MQHLKLFTSKDRDTYVKKRKGESKFGAHIQLITNFTNIYDNLVTLDVDYVIFGISESIGVLANHGKTGTHKTWEATLKVLLNIQSASILNAKRVLILGHLDYSEWQNQLKQEVSKKKAVSKAKTYVNAIDKDVTHIVASIVKAGKTPIIIGGGHNNAYGNIKGTALAKDKPINVINFDAHTDFRAEEGRHSGNGFRYALNEGFLKNYFIFGIHENYTSAEILSAIKKHKSVVYNTFESIEIRQELSFNTELDNALAHINNTTFGIELDCDAITNIPSSAKTPSGFSVNKARQFIHYMAQHNKAGYLHICEAAPNKKQSTAVGKLISYFITDFIKANDQNH